MGLTAAGSVSRRLAASLEVALGEPILAMARVGGGDVAESFRVELPSGPVFAKTHRDPPPNFFTTEATGLGWLRDAAELRVPAVLAVSDGGDDAPAFLALEWVPEERGARPDEVAFGSALARVHRVGLPTFGREDRRTTGSRALPNDPCDTWVEFFATRRLLPLRRLAAESEALPPRTLALLDRVVEHLAELGGPPEPPARLHGDLWAGNRLVDANGRSWLIDPAAHGGHREFDLAMMRLFGGFGPDAFDAYHDEFPLAAGWERRVPLHQLAPLIVHAVKFGGGYAGATERALVATLGV